MKWEKSKFDDIVKLTKGKKHTEVEDQAAYPYLQIEDLHGTGTNKYTNEQGVECNTNDILIAWDGANAGKVGTGLEGMAGSTLARIRVTSEIVSSRYLYWFLSSNFDVIKSKRTGATIPHVNGSELRSMEVPLPPLHIQEQIADTLDKADALRRKDQELLQKYDELAQSIFYDMFGDPVRNEKGWDVKNLEDIIYPNEKISYGIVQPGDEDPTGVPVIRVGDFENMTVKSVNVKRVSKTIEGQYQKTRLVGDELLIACVGSIGKIALVNNTHAGYNIVRATARVRPNHQLVDRVFLASLLSTPKIQEYFTKETRTVSQPTLNISHIASTCIALPPIKLQKKFSNIYSNIQKQKQKTQQTFFGLFETLLNKYFQMS
jgi:type I restriction enzyme S subunit